MTRISDHFVRAEFSCKCGCAFDTVDAELIEVLETVRAVYGAPVTINSGCRCPAHNKSVGGGRYSQHLKGRAADIVVKGVSARDVYDWLCAAHKGELGIGSYDTFTHVDTRSGCARWKG